ncbi:GlxA family transcriptional regulator [Propionicicella superfundia]|uniref:GlxA family transcriptional regulator n=1 Tax=Propionicicella superfundia TaxID=348582 RepID=UPI0003FD3224|nr:helix-turn-helix domain-containing protein [Propionicicella superfundia]
MALRSVSVIVLEPVAVFEFGVVVEVFGVDRTADDLPPFDFRVCAVEPGRPLAGKATTPLAIVPGHGLDDVGGSDLVVVAPTPPLPDDAYPREVLDVLREAPREGSTLLSVCSGSFVLGAAGLLDGLACTTHWMYADDLQRRYPSARVDPSVLYVDTGSIITSAGTAAGVDACLHVVRRELGAGVANAIARRMVVPPVRDGGQQQYVDRPVPAQIDGGLAPVLDWALATLDRPHTVASLAERAAMSERSFARHFQAETGTTPHRWLNQQRVLAARSLLERGDLPVERVADQVGFRSAVVLRDHFRRATGLTPTVYRQRFGGLGLEPVH